MRSKSQFAHCGDALFDGACGLPPRSQIRPCPRPPPPERRRAVGPPAGRRRSRGRRPLARHGSTSTRVRPLVITGRSLLVAPEFGEAGNLPFGPVSQQHRPPSNRKMRTVGVCRASARKAGRIMDGHGKPLESAGRNTGSRGGMETIVDANRYRICMAENAGCGTLHAIVASECKFRKASGTVRLLSPCAHCYAANATCTGRLHNYGQHSEPGTGANNR